MFTYELAQKLGFTTFNSGNDLVIVCGGLRESDVQSAQRLLGVEGEVEYGAYSARIVVKGGAVRSTITKKAFVAIVLPALCTACSIQPGGELHLTLAYALLGGALLAIVLAGAYFFSR